MISIIKFFRSHEVSSVSYFVVKSVTIVSVPNRDQEVLVVFLTDRF